MGGVACIIIINCGALKARAEELATLEGEICDLGPEISEYLTPEEKLVVDQRAADAWEFGQRIQHFADEQASFFRQLADKYKNS